MSTLSAQRKQKLDRGRCWYVVHTYSGYEEAVRRGMLQRVETLGMQDLIFDVMVPTYTDVELKKNKSGVEKKEKKKHLFPGYVLVNMVVTDESWYIVRNTPHVTGFVGVGNTPMPITEEEFARITGNVEAVPSKVQIDIDKGDLVRILEGPFAQYEAVVSDVDAEKAKIKVMISLFGRETPVELEYHQIQKQ